MMYRMPGTRECAEILGLNTNMRLGIERLFEEDKEMYELDYVVGADMWARAGDESISWAIEEYGTPELAAKAAADVLKDETDGLIEWEGEVFSTEEAEKFILAYIASA